LQGRQKVGGCQALGGKHTVQSLQRELPAIAQEVREMGLSKAGLARQKRDTERAPLYPAQQFQAESFVHLRKIHLWKICRQQWQRTVSVFLWKSYLC
jgi:hypothetical protein